jgi:antitoxin YefM
MPIETTYTQARENLAALWDEVTANQEIVIIHRRGAKDIALIEADELRGLIETAHLIRSPRNAQRLLTALNRALANEGSLMSVERLRQQMGLLDEAESSAETS